MSIKILVLDDEELSRIHIQDLIVEFAANAIVHVAESVDDALKIINENDIDIIFSDIEMPGKNSFEMLKSLSHRGFSLVFVTAYSQYAIQALKEGAADYILKPIKKSEFKEILLRLISEKEKKNQLLNLKFNDKNPYLTGKLSLNHQQGIKFVTLKDIIYLEAQNSYTIVYLINNEKITISKAINKFESKLDPTFFFRIHKSHIINLYHFKEYVSKDGDFAIMDNGVKLYISRYRLSDFLSLLEDLSGKI